MWMAFVTLALARAETTINCNYSYQNFPTATVQIYVDDTGAPASSAQIAQPPGSPVHKESVTPEARASDEFLHIWLSKENAGNAIEMVVYRDPKTQGNSVLINHNVPFGQEMWGNCTGLK